MRLLAAQDLQHADVRHACRISDGTERMALSACGKDSVTALLRGGGAPCVGAPHTDQGIHLQGGKLGTQIRDRLLALRDELFVAHLGVGETGLPHLKLRLKHFGGCLGDELISSHAGKVAYRLGFVKGTT